MISQGHLTGADNTTSFQASYGGGLDWLSYPKPRAPHQAII